MDIAPEWILTGTLIVGLVTMLFAIGTGSSGGNPESGPRMAVGMTPTDAAITMRLRQCGSEAVSSVSLRTVEPALTIWEAIAVETDDRYVFVAGQAPTTFTETVPMLEELPRGVLLEAQIEADEVHSVQFLYADLLPELWSYNGTYYPEGVIGAAIEAATTCRGAVDQTTSGRRVIMLIGFVVAAAAGAGLIARRMVSSDRA